MACLLRRFRKEAKSGLHGIFKLLLPHQVTGRTKTIEILLAVMHMTL